MFLAGYPHVKRYSTGVHDSLLSSALYVQSGSGRALIIANDIIYAPKQPVLRIRRAISEKTGVPEANILISATHTHSGPKTTDTLSNEADTAVPKHDPEYVKFFEQRLIEVGVGAVQSAVPAETGLARCDAIGVGTNRRDPMGSKDLEVPVMVVRDAKSHQPIAAMLVCCMHPTVMHEGSTLISGDFPGMARQYLKKNMLGENCAVLYHTGPAGNQSPRHVVNGQTFAEAERLGMILGKAAEGAIGKIQFRRDVNISCKSAGVALELKTFPSEADAQKKLDQSVARLKHLRETGAPRTEVRTAETDWFGAQETLTLSRAASQGRLDAVVKACLPAEIQAIWIGPWAFVAWPGEFFVEFGLEVKKHFPNTYVISYANGELQGYLVTRQAVAEGGYESSNAIFKSPEGGDVVVQKTLELLKNRDG
jgi:hypothetical protein